MPVKINISDKGKTHKLELDLDVSGKKLGEKIKGEEISSDLAGYELEITGASDSSGFPYIKEYEGQAKIRKLLTYGKAMKDTRKGIRLKKTLRGNTLSQDLAQINLKVIKHGHKKFEDLLPKKEQAEAPPKEQVEEKKVETKEETPKPEQKNPKATEEKIETK